MNIYQKMVEIRKAIGSLEKDTEGHNYEYVSGSQILEKIIGKMNELGVILEPHVTHAPHIITDYKDKYGKDKRAYIIDCPMKYHWVNSDDPADRIICEWSLYGSQDDVSKAFGSGLTYSERYFLLKYFGVPTDNADPDQKDDKPEKPKKDEELQKVINEIGIEAKKLSSTPELKEKLVTTIKSIIKVVNYNTIKDIEIAKKLLDEVKKIK